MLRPSLALVVFVLAACGGTVAPPSPDAESPADGQPVDARPDSAPAPDATDFLCENCPTGDPSDQVYCRPDGSACWCLPSYQPCHY